MEINTNTCELSLNKVGLFQIWDCRIVLSNEYENIVLEVSNKKKGGKPPFK